MEKEHLFWKGGEFLPEKVYWLFNNLQLTALELSEIPSAETDEGSCKIEMDLATAARLVTTHQHYICMLLGELEGICEAMEESNDLHKYLKDRNKKNDFIQWKMNFFS